MKFRNQARRFGAVLAGSLVSAASFATPTPGTYDDIVNAVDFGDVTTGIVAIAAVIAVILVAKKGARMVLGMIR